MNTLILKIYMKVKGLSPPCDYIPTYSDGTSLVSVLLTADEVTEYLTTHMNPHSNWTMPYDLWPLNLNTIKIVGHIIKSAGF